MGTERITSLQNPAVKELVRLRDRRERDRTGTFLIEGYRELRRAIDARVDLTHLYHSPYLYLGDNEPALVAVASEAGAAVVELGEQAFRKVSHRDRPEGLLGVARQFPTDLERLSPGVPALVLIVESIEKPGNLGNMLRTADAAGATVVTCDPTTDPYNPNVVRASLGTLFTVPLAVATTEHAISWLDRHGIETVATTPSARDLYWEADLRGPVGLIVGSEQYGLSKPWLEAAHSTVRIPMAGGTDSLNAAIAAAVVLYEAVRQRTFGYSSARA